MNQPSIIFFGAGNFQRAFLGWMLHRMHQARVSPGRALAVRVTDSGPYTSLEKANWHYAVWTRGLEQGARVDSAEWIDVFDGGVYPYEDWKSFLDLATEPHVSTLISNTTEAGIAYVPEAWTMQTPLTTFPGKLTQWLYHRWQTGGGATAWGVDVLPCELIEQNGQRLAAAVRQYAQAGVLPAEFLRWLAEACTFMDTLVDRIVPGRPAGAGPAELVDNPTTITAEPYHLLVISGASNRFRANWNFAAAGLNVIFTDDLTQYRTLKVRLLNGAHTAMVPVGLLNGITTVREFVEHPRWGVWLKALLFEDIIPTLSGVSPDAAQAYAETVLERFGNPFVEHRLESILLNSFAKWPARLGATAEHYFERDLPLPERLNYAWQCQVKLAERRGVDGFPDAPAVVAPVVAQLPDLLTYLYPEGG